MRQMHRRVHDETVYVKHPVRKLTCASNAVIHVGKPPRILSPRVASP